jgi:hypothetical protein
VIAIGSELDVPPVTPVKMTLMPANSVVTAKPGWMPTPASIALATVPAMSIAVSAARNGMARWDVAPMPPAAPEITFMKGIPSTPPPNEATAPRLEGFAGSKITRPCPVFTTSDESKLASNGTPAELIAAIIFWAITASVSAGPLWK